MINELSVFFPVFNEEKNLFATVTKAREVLNEVFNDWEIIIIDDGSTDATPQEIIKLEHLDSRIKSFAHKINRGYGAAFKSGIYNCHFNWIAFTDADGQFDFSEITKFTKRQEETGADLVVGYYLRRSVRTYRKLNTFLWQAVVRNLFGLKVKDIDCGFKLFSKKVVDTIPHLESERGAFVSTEFLVKTKKEGFEIAEVGVHHFPRKAGVGTGSKLEVIIRSFSDLFKLWKELK